MISREEMAKEFILRDNIQKAIKIINERSLQSKSREIIEEIKLRSIVQSLLLEAAVDPDDDPHENTGINILSDLIKNSNFLKTIRTGYKALTTSKDQRDSYRAHIVNAIQNSLAPIMNTQTEVNEDVSEEIEVDIEKEKFIETDPDRIKDEVPEEEEVSPEEEFGIEGHELTGRDRAFTDFNKIEQSIIDHYGMLNDPVDQEKFYDYLITNTKLYFDRYEEELSGKVDEPSNDEYESAKSGEAMAASEPDQESPGELEDIL